MLPPSLRAALRVACIFGWALGLTVSSVTVSSVQAQRFFPDDPIWKDPDRLDMPIPDRRSTGSAHSPFNVLTHSLGLPGRHDGPALNVNTLGEVPNSSWYTNRFFARQGSEGATSRTSLVQGAALTVRPDTSAPLQVVQISRRHGLEQARIRDAQGRRFQLLFDASGAPELATGAAMIASRFLHAFGYFVPEHGLMHLTPSHLTAASDSATSASEVARLFERSASDARGRYRALVTRLPDAQQELGPFRFHDVREDDGNDVFPHEARRELRGLRVFAAWLNHTKLTQAHTLAAVVKDSGATYVRHYLTHLETTLGSAGHRAKLPWSGHEHMLEISPVLTRISTLGISGGDWMDAATPEIRGVGHFEAAHFDPRAWRVEVPNPAFERCDPDDAFWAARFVAALSRSDIAAVVKTARYSDPRAATYITDTLNRRRQAIVSAYLHWGGGLGRFRTHGTQLAFADLYARHGDAADTAAPARTVQWHVFDNKNNRLAAALGTQQIRQQRLEIPSASARYLRSMIRTPHLGRTAVYLRRTLASEASRYEVVGIERFGPNDE